MYGGIDARDIGTCLNRKGRGADSRGRDPMWVVCDYRGQSWYGIKGNVAWEVSERKDHIVAQIIEKYITGTK